jgi:RNA polymerase sigma-70 factor (family 1)
MPLPEPHRPRSSVTDADLCARMRQGDEHAFGLLFERYYVPLCRYATTLTGNADASEDVVQALFVHVWARRDTWVVRDSIRGYLYQAVHRRIVSEWRAARVRRRHASTERGQDATDAGSWPDARTEQHEVDAAYRRAVAALPDRARQAFELNRHHGLTCREIANVMGISVRTVEVHVGRAVIALRKALVGYLAIALAVSGR